MGKFDGWLLVTDFDDTLRPQGRDAPVPEENRRAAERFMDGGGRFTIATGRDPRSFLRIRDRIRVNAPVILSNGAVIFDPESLESLYESFLPFSCREDLGALLAAFPGTGLEIHRGADVRVCRRNDNVEEHLARMDAPVLEAPMEKLLFPWTKAVVLAEGGLHEENAVVHAMAAWLEERFPGRYAAMPSGAILDVAAGGNDKGTGVRRLAGLLDIRPGRVVCVGDSWNDLPMLEAADRAFAPANALEAVRRHPGVTAVGPCETCLRDVVERLERES